MENPQPSGLVTDHIIPRAAPVSGVAQFHPGVLRLSGKDASDFLNRMSTNDLSKLRNGEYITTVLTTEKGRMIDVIRVLSLDDGLLILTGEGSEKAVRHWLEKYVIMEEIQLRSATEDHFALMLFGESIPAALSTAGLGSLLPENNSMLILRPYGDTTVAFRDDLWSTPVVTLFAEGIANRLGTLRSELLRGASALPREILEAYMIEEGVPSAGAEISAEHNPLECNFWRFVSFTKGCYIGQEVIARLDSYHKLQKRMTGFQFEQGITPGPAPGSIFADGEESGTMTRSALSPRGDRWIGIGFLKLGADTSKLTFGSHQAAGRPKVNAVTLPFTMS